MKKTGGLKSRDTLPLNIFAEKSEWALSNHTSHNRFYLRAHCSQTARTTFVRGEVKFNPECADISTRGTDRKMLHKTIIKQ